MKAIAQFQWLYILYVVAGIVIGILGIRATILLVKGKQNAEKSALITLVLGILTGGIHMFTSRENLINQYLSRRSINAPDSFPIDQLVLTDYINLPSLNLYRAGFLKLFKRASHHFADCADPRSQIILCQSLRAAPIQLILG